MGAGGPGVQGVPSLAERERATGMATGATGGQGVQGIPPLTERPMQTTTGVGTGAAAGTRPLQGTAFGEGEAACGLPLQGGPTPGYFATTGVGAGTGGAGAVQGGAIPTTRETVTIPPAVREKHVTEHVQVHKPEIERDVVHTDVRHVPQVSREQVVAPGTERVRVLPTREAFAGQQVRPEQIVRPVESVSVAGQDTSRVERAPPTVAESHRRRQVDVTQPVVERQVVHPDVTVAKEPIREHVATAPKHINEQLLRERGQIEE
jgi:hypothetical protein